MAADRPHDGGVDAGQLLAGGEGAGGDGHEIQHLVHRDRNPLVSPTQQDNHPALALAAGEPGLLARPSVLHYLGFFK